MSTAVDDVPIVDVDSHVAEPEDLWTSRMPARLGDAIPRVVWDEAAGESRWKVGDVLLSAVGEYCSAGWPEHFPSHPPTLEDADPACYDAEGAARAARRVRRVGPGALPERDRVRRPRLPHRARPGDGRRSASRRTTTSSPSSPAPTRAGSSR